MIETAMVLIDRVHLPLIIGLFALGVGLTSAARQRALRWAGMGLALGAAGFALLTMPPAGGLGHAARTLDAALVLFAALALGAGALLARRLRILEAGGAHEQRD